MTKGRIETMHKLALEVIKEQCTIIQKVITDCITPITKVTVKVGKDDNGTDLIIVTFDNSLLRYVGSVDLNTYIDTCIEHDIPTAIKLVACTTLRGFSNCMIDLFFNPIPEQDKILKKY